MAIKSLRKSEKVKIIVKYHDKEKATTKLKEEGATIKCKYTHFPMIAASIKKDKLDKIRQHPSIANVEMDGTVEALDELDNSWGVKQIGGGTVHEQGIMGQGIKVAVIDTGVDYTHPELVGIYRGGYDFYNDDPDPMDDNRHGTHCAGIVSAALNGIGVVGVAPRIELYALKVLGSTGSGNWSDIIAAIDWCIDNGIQITSNSYGGDHSDAVELVFQTAWNVGILSIASAGNSGGGSTSDKTGYPARFESIIAVGATDRDNRIAYFSSTGPATEVVAPGVLVNSCLLNGAYGELSGTSMSCPHVAGLAALIKSAHSDWDNEIIRGQIRTAADGESHNWVYGFGIVDAVRSCGELIPNPPPMPELPPASLSPIVQTEKPRNVTSNSVTLRGTLLDMGTSDSVIVRFYIGFASSPDGWSTPDILMTELGEFSININQFGGIDMLPKRRYRYFAFARGSNNMTDIDGLVYFKTHGGKKLRWRL